MFNIWFDTYPQRHVEKILDRISQPLFTSFTINQPIMANKKKHPTASEILSAIKSLDESELMQIAKEVAAEIAIRDEDLANQENEIAAKRELIRNGGNK